MGTYIDAIHDLSVSVYNGLKSTTMPVLNCSFLTFILAVLLINCFLWALSVLTQGKQNQSAGGRLDDNNNYVYRR